MKAPRLIIILLILSNLSSCIINYVPDINDYEEVLVVDGLITDQPGTNTVNISKSYPIWKRKFPKRLSDCIVTITDDLGNIYSLKETRTPGVYITDSSYFQGIIGREYTLSIRTTKETPNLSYESLPMKMIPIPPIDSIYYEKMIIPHLSTPIEGCNIYLNTHDPSNNCRFYRWEYSETWEIRIPFNFPNKVCWVSNASEKILIKNASLFSETIISGYPILSITDPADRFSEKYSILINQYSLNKDEYHYWEQLKNTVGQTGGLYDLIPANALSNIYCIENPYQKVLGYFSVSALASKRLFIKGDFSYLDSQLEKCMNGTDTTFTTRPDTLQGLNTFMWVLKEIPNIALPGYIYTYDKGCVDCRTRGTPFKPEFWIDDK